MKNIARYLAVAAFVGVFGSATKALAFEELVTPTAVGCVESGECFIKISPALSSSNTTCADRTQVRFLSSMGGAEFMYKTALSAFLAGRKLIINPWTSPCQSGFPRPSYLHVGAS